MSATRVILIRKTIVPRISVTAIRRDVLEQTARDVIKAFGGTTRFDSALLVSGPAQYYAAPRKKAANSGTNG